jgi:hypothetical protein
VQDIEVVTVYGNIWNGMGRRKTQAVANRMARRGYDMVSANGPDLAGNTTLIFQRRSAPSAALPVQPVDPNADAAATGFDPSGSSAPTGAPPSLGTTLLRGVFGLLKKR